MKRLLFSTLVLALLASILVCPVVLASNCTYRSYGYSAPSYNYGNSYNYSTNYGHSTYYGHSYYQPGTTYWPGGYYSGYGWTPGYYSAGFYDYYAPGYNKSYSSCSYHAPNYAPVVPYFPKYEAAVLLARFPSYGVYARPELPESVSMPTGGYNHAGGGANHGSVYGYSTGNAVDGKLDRILVAVQTVSTDIAELKAWRISVDSRLGGAPGRAPAPNPGSVPPPNPEESRVPTPEKSPGGNEPGEQDVMVLGPNIMHSKCAGCHDEKKVQEARSKVILFVTGPEGAELATRNGKNEITAIPLKTLQDCRDLIVKRMMPPKKDKANKPVPQLTAKEQATVTEFLSKVIAQSSNAPAGPAVR